MRGVEVRWSRGNGGCGLLAGIRRVNVQNGQEPQKVVKRAFKGLRVLIKMRQFWRSCSAEATTSYCSRLFVASGAMEFLLTRHRATPISTESRINPAGRHTVPITSARRSVKFMTLGTPRFLKIPTTANEEQNERRIDLVSWQTSICLSS
jgi:hypothetical protein